jgi:putative ABC transport system permease protein
MFRLKDPGAFDEQSAPSSDPQTVGPAARVDVLRRQTSIAGIMLRALAGVTSIMAVGAIFGAVNTMYAAVGSRTPEIAVLLTLGFRPRQVLTSFWPSRC